MKHLYTGTFFRETVRSWANTQNSIILPSLWRGRGWPLTAIKLVVGFHPTFSCHTIAETSLALVVWLNENVPNMGIKCSQLGNRNQPSERQ